MTDHTDNPHAMSPHSRAMLLNVLWHHQGGSSAVGQPIRKILGMDEHDRLTDAQIAEAKWIDGLLSRASVDETRIPATTEQTEYAWFVVDRGGNGEVDIDAPHQQLGQVTVLMGVHPERARRIVACVNTLQDAKTEDLETAVRLGITDVSMGNLFSARLALRKRCDKLLTALKKAAAHVRPTCSELYDDLNAVITEVERDV